MGTDYDWCRKRRQKWEHRHCITEGKQKGDSCQATIFDKYCAKRSRAYKDKKHANYYEAFLNKAKKYDKKT